MRVGAHSRATAAVVGSARVALSPGPRGGRCSDRICLYFQGGERGPDLADLTVEPMNAPQEKRSAPPPDPNLPSAPSEPAPPRPREIGGRDGPEPTRFGDWEKAGRCIDF
jgi:hypothetical protein